MQLLVCHEESDEEYPPMVLSGERMPKTQIAGDLNYYRLHAEAFSERHPGKNIHHLGKNSFSVYRSAGHGRVENLLEGLQDLEGVISIGNVVVAADECFEDKAKENKEEGGRFIAVIDVIRFRKRAARRGRLGLAVKSIEDKVAVLLDQARNGIHKIQPDVLVELDQELVVVDQTLTGSLP